MTNHLANKMLLLQNKVRKYCRSPTGSMITGLYTKWRNLNTQIMAKYSEKASEKVEETMHEMKEGKLKSGSGKKVTSKKQAIAIGLSEARKAGAKVPRKKS
ncbi:hypothetical protein N824_20720 [Pedobacter sp. V48]|nr:hypothetical protein N824_20720 [Pedobacter sp. V48]